MKRLITIIVLVSLLISTILTQTGCNGKPEIADMSHGEWELVFKAETGGYFNALYFADVNHGWVVGNSGATLYAEDGGCSWEVIESGTENDLKCICFSGNQKGWIAGSGGALGITTDSGKNWEWQRPGGNSEGSFLDLYFTDEFNGWLVNNYGRILHTEDGGTTWVLQDSGTSSAITSVLFLDEEKGWAIVNKRIVLSTEDGGDNWDALEVNLSLPGGTMFTDVYFVDRVEGWITTTTGACSDSRVTYSPLLHTTDGGDSWSVQASPQDKWLKSIRMVGRDQGWLLGMSGLYYTEDGGNSWVLQLDSEGDPFVDICIPDNKYPWVLSYTGKIYKYTANPVTKEEIVTKSWQVGEHWQYSPQAIWVDTFIGVEYIFGDGLEGQYISTYKLSTKEKKCVLEFDPAEFRISPPSIYENRIVWSSADISGRLLSEIDWDKLNWDIFLLNLNTGEVRQITGEEHAQIEPRIYGDTIVWLDTRHEEGYHNPNVYDVYAYDLKTGQERRLTSSTSAEGHDLSIRGNLVVWSDNRHAEWDKATHAGNEPDYNNEIYAYDLSANVEHRITNYAGNDHYPAIDGSRIVWLRQLSLREAEVYLYDFFSSSGQETQVSNGRYAAYGPSISGDVTVWADARISQGNTAGDVMEGMVSGNEIVYMSGAAEIYLYDLSTGKETLLVPSAGTEYTMTVRSEERKNVDRQVWLNPVVHGDFVVYTNSRQIGSIVYAMRLDHN